MDIICVKESLFSGNTWLWLKFQFVCKMKQSAGEDIFITAGQIDQCKQYHIHPN